MANPSHPEAISDDFFEQIFAYGGAPTEGQPSGRGEAVGGFVGSSVFPHNLLGLSLEQGGSGGGGFEKVAAVPKPELSGLFPPFGHMQAHQIRPSPPAQNFHSQATPTVAATPPAPRPRVRARRGQATDPHSIAERLRRERIAERMRALQELVPSSNKTDRAAMLDEIVDYVKFLRLQVKVLSMSRLGGAGAVAQLVADIPLSSVEGVPTEDKQVWEKWSTDGTEQKVAELMEEDVGAAMQYLQSKALCIMPISLAATIYNTPNQQEASSVPKLEQDASS